MTKLQKLLSDFTYSCYITDKVNGEVVSKRFLFNTDQDRFTFITLLNKLNAEYMLFEDNLSYRIEVFLG